MQVFAEADNVNTFTMLRYAKVHCVDSLRWNYIIANFIKMLKNRFKGFTAFMNHQTFHVLQEECLGLLATKDFFNLKEKRTSRFILKSQSLTCQRESLTRETTAKYIKTIRNITLSYFLGDVTKGHFSVVCKIGALCLCVEF